MKVISKIYWLLIAVFVLLVLWLALRYVSKAQMPTDFTSSDLVAIVSIVVGGLVAVLTVFIQLRGDKDGKIFEQKISVYSEFTKQMWGFVKEEGYEITDEDLRKLRAICFQKLVLYLDCDQIREITHPISCIRDRGKDSIGRITYVLQENLNFGKKRKSNEDEVSKRLRELYNSFDIKESVEKEESIQIEAVAQNCTQESQQVDNKISFWHFNILYEKQQIEAFKAGNWVLALIEYGEEWRTNLIKQVKPNDVIFLYKRGGAGYIGAFKALDPPSKILQGKNYAEYSKDECKQYDIYDNLKDGVDFASNIRVEPIAYNFKGVGCYSVRRRTIERINDMDAVKFLLERFNGEKLSTDQLVGKGKLDDKTSIELDESYFSEVVKQS